MARNRFIDSLTLQATSPYVPSIQPIQRWGKAPPVDPFTAENKEMRFDDWIPTLERAAAWNNWSEEEKLMQLAGHLRSKALQEWGLMSADEKTDYYTAVTTLRTH